MKRTTTILLLIALCARAAVCAAENPVDTARAAAAPDPALAVSATAALFGHREKKLILVDVRPPRQYERCHIPGSLNIAPHALETRGFLKTKPLVLVNQGFAVTPLIRTCAALDAAGFRAGVLAGGLPAWKAAGGALAGDPFEQTDLNHLTPEGFYPEHGAVTPLVFDAAAPDDRRAALLPGAVHLGAFDPEKSAGAIERLVAAQTADPFARWVIVTPDGRQNALIQRDLSRRGLDRLFYLQGGRAAWETYLQRPASAGPGGAKRRQIAGPGCASCAAKQKP